LRCDGHAGYSGGINGALDSQTPGIKKVLAETIQDAIKGLPDQDNPHGMRETMQVFYDVHNARRAARDAVSLN
jgi:hypothetical protein